MLNVIEDATELTRRGFVTNYPIYRQWHKEAVRDGLIQKPLNVYLHLPYCVQRCDYCHYKTTTLRTTQLAQIDRYVDALCQEITLATARFHLRERPTISLYLGGGTPTLLSERNLKRLFVTLRRELTLVNPEITVEGEPVTLTPRKAELLAEQGVNRISVGIQSFSDDIVARTGRKDTEKQALQAIDVALKTGAVVNIDLISGLPGETPETWAYSVRRAIDTDVHSVTVYKLEIYANTEYFAASRQQRIVVPSDHEELELARHALLELGRAAYKPVNFFTCTKRGGYIQRHITTKWQGVDTYAFGSSAFGSLGNWAFQNTIELDRYSEQVEQGQLPIFRGYLYNALELMTRDVLLGMKLIRLDRGTFKARHGVDLTRVAGQTLDRLEADGFVTVTPAAIALTDKGILHGDYTGRVLASTLEALAH